MGDSNGTHSRGAANGNLQRQGSAELVECGEAGGVKMGGTCSGHRRVRSGVINSFPLPPTTAVGTTGSWDDAVSSGTMGKWGGGVERERKKTMVMRMRMWVKCVQRKVERHPLAIVLVTMLVALFVLPQLPSLWERRPSCNPGRVDPVPNGEKFTVVLNTFRRPERLKTAIAHYSTCATVVARIRVPWSEPDVPMPKPETDGQYFNKCVEVGFVGYDTTSINNRFRPIPDIPAGSAIFSVDDDVHVSCSSLAFAFEVWQSARDNMVGYIPRSHSYVKKKDGEQSLRYLYWWHVWWTGSYSIVLTKASFFHEKYMKEYTERMKELEIDAYVDAHKNCEDIAMQFLVSNMTNMGPIFTNGHYVDSGAIGGISTQHGVLSPTKHYRARDDCMNEFTKRFGRMPLVMSHVHANKAGSWVPFMTPGSWLEYLSPI